MQFFNIYYNMMQRKVESNTYYAYIMQKHVMPLKISTQIACRKSLKFIVVPKKNRK